MAKYKIEYDEEDCVGAAACVVSKNWSIQSNGRAKPKIKEFDDEKTLAQEMEAAKACPANAIHIVETKTGKRLI